MPLDQAEAAGAVLAASGHFDKLDLVVVSPFRRTLETAAHMLSAARDSGHSIRTVVHPLAAEHTLLRSGLQQGDRGSTAEQLRKLFPAADYPQYDFEEIDRYCAARGLEDGKWWHHNAGPLATRSQSHTYHQTVLNFALTWQVRCAPNWGCCVCSGHVGPHRLHDASRDPRLL